MRSRTRDRDGFKPFSGRRDRRSFFRVSRSLGGNERSPNCKLPRTRTSCRLLDRDRNCKCLLVMAMRHVNFGETGERETCRREGKNCAIKAVNREFKGGNRPAQQFATARH